MPTANGEDGDCGDFLPIGETCQPTCDDGYVSDGPTTCEESDGNYVPSRAVCSLAIEYTTTVTLLINAQVVGHFVHGEFNPVTRAVNHAQLAYGDANEMPELFVARLGANLNTASFRGTMDELRVWDLAVSKSDIEYWAEREIGVHHGSYLGLVAYYDFTHDPTEPTKVGARGNGTVGLVAESSMTMTLNGARWTRLADGRTANSTAAAPFPPPPSPSPPVPPWPVLAEGSTEYRFTLEFSVSLADLNSQTLSKRRRLLAAEPSTGLGRRLLNAVFGWKLDSKAEASVTTLDDSKSDGRRLLQDTSPADTFLEALRAAMVEQTGLDEDNVRLGAVTETDTGGISVEFSLVFEEGDTTDLTALTDTLDDPVGDFLGQVTGVRVRLDDI